MVLAASYQPTDIEEKWSQVYVNERLGRPNTEGDEQFVMVMPPPNVTGSLHLGHTMMAAVEDTMCRWHRMAGHEVLWIPGLDHAGIATQSVVERHLMKTENLSRHDLGREAFINRVSEWKESRGGRILYQLKRLGCSCDWDRQAYTMSPALVTAVNEAFVRFFEAGLIYRADRLVSWCPYLQTALSDIEVDTRDVEKPERINVPGFEKTVEVGSLWIFEYPVKGEENRRIAVGTTRLETMLGDVAVAVNPTDPRYQDLIGKELVHPFFPDRHLVVVGDNHCDPEFGTGAVKITPAHDKNDYEVAQRHNLPFINIFTLDGKINTNGGSTFEGMHRFEARTKVEKALTEKGLFVEKIKNPKKMTIPICSRSGDVIEYMMVPQWYVKCGDMAKRAMDAGKSGELKFRPEEALQQWEYWLGNIQDWCISRQLWWGHRIPAFRLRDENNTYVTKDDGLEWWIAATSADEAKAKFAAAGATTGVVEQDTDVLDTWFSSGLFPLSTVGWPNEESEDFKRYFPGTMLETGGDILFFWVARMVMMSLQLTDKLPFQEVFLHPMVRDSHGKKMSKSLGNVIDPIDVINGITLDELLQQIQGGQVKQSEIKRATDATKKDYPKGIETCGADALRFGLLAYLKGGRSVNLDINRVVAYRHFCNKIFNATKFCLMYVNPAIKRGFDPNTTPKPTQWADRWILHSSSMASRKANEGLKGYDFDKAVTATYSHWLYDFCDVYLELLKPRLFNLLEADNVASVTDDQTAAIATLLLVVDRALKMLHPLMPFITEELWQAMRELYHAPSERLMTQVYPEALKEWESPELEGEMDLFMDCVRHFRSMLAQFEVPNKARLNAYLKPCAEHHSFLESQKNNIACLAKLGDVTILGQTEEFESGWVTNVVSDKIRSALDSAGHIDFKRVQEKLLKRIGQTEKALAGLVTKTKVPDYITRVPEEVRQRNAESIDAYNTELSALRDALACCSSQL